MTSPLNEQKARRFVENKRLGSFSEEMFARGYLERVEQEKLRNAELEERTAATAMKLLRAQEALQAADRMANFISNRPADEFYGEDFDRLDADITIYRAARAKVGG